MNVLRQTESPFDPAVIERGLAEVNADLDAIALNEVDQGIREWIPNYAPIPFERLHFLRFLLKRATGQYVPTQPLTPISQ